MDWVKLISQCLCVFILCFLVLTGCHKSKQPPPPLKAAPKITGGGGKGNNGDKADGAKFGDASSGSAATSELQLPPSQPAILTEKNQIAKVPGWYSYDMVLQIDKRERGTDGGQTLTIHKYNGNNEDTILAQWDISTGDIAPGFYPLLSQDPSFASYSFVSADIDQEEKLGSTHSSDQQIYLKSENFESLVKYINGYQQSLQWAVDTNSGAPLVHNRDSDDGLYKKGDHVTLQSIPVIVIVSESTSIPKLN